MGQEYPVVTRDQIEMWEQHPVTKTFLDCVQFFIDDVREEMGKGMHVDSSNADMTHAMTHTAMGQIQGLISAKDYETLFNRYKVVLIPQEEVTEEETDVDE